MLDCTQLNFVTMPHPAKFSLWSCSCIPHSLGDRSRFRRWCNTASKGQDAWLQLQYQPVKAPTKNRGRTIFVNTLRELQEPRRIKRTFMAVTSNYRFMTPKPTNVAAKQTPSGSCLMGVMYEKVSNNDQYRNGTDTGRPNHRWCSAGRRNVHGFCC